MFMRVGQHPLLALNEEELDLALASGSLKALARVYQVSYPRLSGCAWTA